VDAMWPLVQLSLSRKGISAVNSHCPAGSQRFCHTPCCHLLQAARKSYVDAIQLLVELASLQTAFLTLDEAIKTTNRRVNALDSVVIPRLENTIAYIKARPV